MPPKKSKSREGNAVLPEPSSRFPFRVGDEVEMKSFESGYRGAWFRVQIKRVRLDRKGSILSTMVYKDFSDQSEEEISAFERDPASDQPVLMIRPLPPPFVKESRFNKSVHTKMCVVYRDDWAVGDLVDWWYHHCWWAAKVISVVGDGRFQLVCPAPPGGEGGVYLANSRDMRPSLKWSIAAQWTAPPSKEVGKIPCARIVRLLDSNEAAEFAVPNQDQLPKKRGRPKVTRVVSNPSLSQGNARAAYLNPDRELVNNRRPRLVQVSSPPLCNQEIPEGAAPNRGTKIPQKRGRPKKVEEQEEVVQKRSRPIVIKIIHPRQDTGNDKVEHTSRNPVDCEKRLGVMQSNILDIQPENEVRHGLEYGNMLDGQPGNEMSKGVTLGSMCDVHPENETRKGVRQGSILDIWPENETGKGVKQESTVKDIQPEDERRMCLEKASPVMEKQSDKVNIPRTLLVDDSRQVFKQKRAVHRTADKVDIKSDTQVSNGHSEDAKRRKLQHTTRSFGPNAGHEQHKTQTLRDQFQDGKNGQDWKKDVKGPEVIENNLDKELMMRHSKVEKKQKNADEGKVATKTLLISRVGDVVAKHMCDLVPREQITLPGLDEGKESSADQISGQDSKDEKQNGEPLVETLSSNLISTLGDIRMSEGLAVDDQAYKDALDLKVLNAYEEAFVDDTYFDSKKACLTEDSLAALYEDTLTQEICSGVQKPPLSRQDISLLRGHEEAFTEDIGLAKLKRGLSKDGGPAKSKLAKPRELSVSCSQRKDLKVTQAGSPFQGISFPDTKSSTLHNKHTKKPASFSEKFTHDLLIRTPSSSLDTISVGGSPDSFPSRIANISTEEAMKDVAACHDVTSLDDEDSGSSLHFGSSQDNTSGRSASMGLNPSKVGGLTNKTEKQEPSPSRKRIQNPVLNHKVSLSRKLVDQARREVSAKRRRSCRSTRRR